MWESYMCEWESYMCGCEVCMCGWVRCACVWVEDCSVHVERHTVLASLPVSSPAFNHWGGDGSEADVLQH